MKWSKAILDYHFNLSTDLVLPDGVDWLFPYAHEETRRCMTEFYQRYYDDDRPRVMILGINPGRFGAGVTGVPFTDPVRLELECCIENTFHKRQELSSLFVYDIVRAFGGPLEFYRRFYITSVCPLGFVKDGKNYNYYDSTALTRAVLPMIVQNLEAQISFGARTDIVFSMGQGKNYTFLNKLNQEYELFDEIVPLPHPRWVMQYRLKRKDEFLAQYIHALSQAIAATG